MYFENIKKIVDLKNGQSKNFKRNQIKKVVIF